MNSSTELQDQQHRFMDEVAEQCSFSGKQYQVFHSRFDRCNFAQENEVLAASLWAEDIADPKQTFQDHLKIICDRLRQEGCPVQESAQRRRGRPLKSESPWKVTYDWLWHTHFPEWQKQNVAQFKAASNPDWPEVCRRMLDKQIEDRRLRRKATALGFEVEIHVGLGLVERKRQQRQQEPGRGESYAITAPEAKGKTYEHETFLRDVIGQPPQGRNKHLAIVGEPGAGKTTLLTAIAQYLAKPESSTLPIFIPLSGLQGKTIKDYILQDWLPEAVGITNPEIADPETLCPEFKQWLRKTPTWLLLDAVDEMGDAAPAQALNQVNTQLTDWLGNVRVALTCRLNVWDANLSSPLTRFDTYKTQEFTADQVRLFIKQWFGQARKPQPGKTLRRKLADPQRERIRDLVKNPLRLSLLCQIFGFDSAADLPTTKAGLYEQFVRYIYEWKQELHSTTAPQRRQLNDVLGKLAVAGLDSKHGLQLFWLPEEAARQVMGDGCFDLACALGWLNIVDLHSSTKEPVYAFFHATFQEYFAALEIKDPDFFMICKSQNWLSGSNVDRVFNFRWREVIALWMGRQNLDNGYKEALIKRLIDFQDELNLGLYEYRKYLDAAYFMLDAEKLEISCLILEKLVDYAFGEYDYAQQTWKKYNDRISNEAQRAFSRFPESYQFPVLKKFVKRILDLESWSILIGLIRYFDKFQIKSMFEHEFLIILYEFLAIISASCTESSDSKADLIYEIFQHFSSLILISDRTIFLCIITLEKLGNIEDYIYKFLQNRNDSSDLSGKRITFSCFVQRNEIYYLKKILQLKDLIIDILNNVSITDEYSINMLEAIISKIHEEQSILNLSKVLIKNSRHQTALEILKRFIDCNSNQYSDFSYDFAVRYLCDGVDQFHSDLDLVLEVINTLNPNNFDKIEPFVFALGNSKYKAEKAANILLSILDLSSCEEVHQEVYRSLAMLLNKLTDKEMISTKIIRIAGNILESTNNFYVKRQASTCLAKYSRGHELHIVISSLENVVDFCEDKLLKIVAIENLIDLTNNREKYIPKLEALCSDSHLPVAWRAIETLQLKDPTNLKYIEIVLKLAFDEYFDEFECEKDYYYIGKAKDLVLNDTRNRDLFISKLESLLTDNKSISKTVKAIGMLRLLNPESLDYIEIVNLILKDENHHDFFTSNPGALLELETVHDKVDVFLLDILKGSEIHDKYKYFIYGSEIEMYFAMRIGMYEYWERELHCRRFGEKGLIGSLLCDLHLDPETIKTISHDEFLALIVSEIGKPFPGQDDRQWNLLWYCAQNMSYTEFYRAWHSRLSANPAISAHPTIIVQHLDLSYLSETLHAVFNESSEVTQRIELVCVDGKQFSDPDNPALDIYIAMQEQGCPIAAEGRPRTMAELKAYWRLEVSRVDRPVALVLYHSGYPDADLSDGCLRGLAGFGGAIVVVRDRPCEGIECVSPHHPDLAAAIGRRLHRLQLEA